MPCFNVISSSKYAPNTHPPFSNIISASNEKTPPDELFLLTLSFALAAYILGFVLFSLILLITGQISTHFPQLTHLSVIICGLKNPTSSSHISIALTEQIS